MLINYYCSLVMIEMYLYFRALKDAERAISLSRDWPKGYFRQGRALAGLKVSMDICRPVKLK